MDRFIVKEGKKLRLGYTTGTCAAAATKAAAFMLLTGETLQSVQITTPSGIELYLDIVNIHKRPDSVSCAVVKDAGDDPDVTHGLKIYSTVTAISNGIEIDGGEGVGRVTISGLAVEIGKAAINPVPFSMIKAELAAMLKSYPKTQGLRAVISVPGGEETAKKTFNPRLGIVGGISILGSTGIVEPMSEKALLDTIYLDMAMRRKQSRILLLTPGNYGADFVKAAWGIDLDKGVKCSNFIGEALDYAVYLGFDSILLVGHAGKLLKLAAGIMNTHSKTADARMEILAAHAGMVGADCIKIKSIMSCITTDAAFDLLDSYGLTESVIESVKQKISQILNYRVMGKAETAFVIFRNKQQILCESNSNEVKLILEHLK